MTDNNENIHTLKEGEEFSEKSPICILSDDCVSEVFNHLPPEDRILVEQGIIYQYFAYKYRVDRG